MSDDEHPELDFDPLDDTKTWPENDFPLRRVGTMTLNRNAGELLRRERADRVRHRRAGRRAGLLRRQDARRPHVLLLRHAAPPRRPELPAAAGQPAQGGPVATNQRDGADGLLRRRDRREPVTSTTSRRSPAGWTRRRSRRTTSRARCRGPADPRARSRAPTTTSRPASATCSPSSGSATTSSPTSPTLLAQCDRPIQERMVWHLLPGRGRARPARRRRPRHQRRRRPPPRAAGRPRRSATRSSRASTNLGNNGPRDVERPRHDALRAQRARGRRGRARLRLLDAAPGAPAV